VRVAKFRYSIIGPTGKNLEQNLARGSKFGGGNVGGHSLFFSDPEAGFIGGWDRDTPDTFNSGSFQHIGELLLRIRLARIISQKHV
jgi:hypothetical protein